MACDITEISNTNGEDSTSFSYLIGRATAAVAAYYDGVDELMPDAEYI